MPPSCSAEANKHAVVAYANVKSKPPCELSVDKPASLVIGGINHRNYPVNLEIKLTDFGHILFDGEDSVTRTLAMRRRGRDLSSDEIAIQLRVGSANPPTTASFNISWIPALPNDEPDPAYTLGDRTINVAIS